MKKHIKNRLKKLNPHPNQFSKSIKIKFEVMLTLVYNLGTKTYVERIVELVCVQLSPRLTWFISLSLTRCTQHQNWCWCCWLAAWCMVPSGCWCTVHRFAVVRQCTSVLTPARHMLHSTRSSGIHSATWLPIAPVLTTLDSPT